MPFFSVVIPVFNKAAYIGKAIESVLSQTFVDFELIIVDDGSTDQSTLVISKTTDDRIRYVFQENKGVSTARNNGVTISSGKYIAFLDADDWWSPEFLQEMSDLIAHFPKASVFSSSYFKVKHGMLTKAQIGVNANFKSGYINYYETYAKTFWVPVNCSFVVVKKEDFLKIGGFNPILRFGEDLELWLRFSLKHQFAFVNKCLAYSNQDVPSNQRALGEKIWPVEQHVLFQLDFLKRNEKENEQLKYLLDGLRLRSFHMYYRKKLELLFIEPILDEVDFKKHHFIYYFYYKFPRIFTEIYLTFKRIGSKIKRHWLNK